MQFATNELNVHVFIFMEMLQRDNIKKNILYLYAYTYMKHIYN